jgi:hypothetical protein
MSARGIVLTVSLLLGGLTAVGAQDAGSDVFDAAAFDQSVQQSTQAEQKTPPGTQFGGSFLYDTSVTTTADFTGYAGGGSFSGKAFVKVTVPDFGSLYAAYNFSKNLYQGAGGTVPGASLAFGGPLLSLAAGDLSDAAFTLAEMHYSFDIAQTVFFRIGNQLLAWGPSTVWTPVDFVNIERVNPLAGLDLRVGKPGVKVTVPFGISNLFLFADLSGTVTATGAGGALVVNDPVETARLAGRWDITLLGYELALSGYVGKDIDTRVGFDFSGRLLGFDVYAEAAAAFDANAAIASWAGSIGAQRTLGELGYWSIATELYYDESGSADATVPSAVIASASLSPLYYGKIYGYAAVTRSHLFVDGVSAGLAGFLDASDLSFLVRLSTTIDVPRLPAFTVNVSWAGGGADKAFTAYSGNNALTAELRMKVEF